MNKRVKADTPPARQIPTEEASWHFFAVLAPLPCGFGWQWQKQGTGAPVTSLLFDFYFECISDARANGYDGPLPPGPKVALPQMPFDPAQTGRLSAALSPKSKNVVMAVTAVSASNAKARRTRVDSQAR